MVDTLYTIDILDTYGVIHTPSLDGSMGVLYLDQPRKGLT